MAEVKTPSLFVKNTVHQKSGLNFNQGIPVNTEKEKTMKIGLMAVFYSIVVLAAVLVSCYVMDFVVGRCFPALGTRFITLTIMLALIAICLVMSATIKRFWVFVPQYVALVTVDFFTGKFRTYFTGTNPLFPQEIVDPDNFVSLDLITVPFTLLCVATDGGVAKVTGILQYLVNRLQAHIYIGVDEENIVKAFITLAYNRITEKIADKETLQVRTKEVLDDIDDHVGKLCRSGEHGEKEAADLENMFGVIFKNLIIGNVSYAAETQKTLDTRYNISMLSGQKDVSDNNLILLDKKTDKKIYTIKLEGVTPEVAQALGKVMSQPAIAGAIVGAAAEKK